MTDDLTTRLRENAKLHGEGVPVFLASTLHEAADRIEALESSLVRANRAIRDQISATKIRENERDAALAVITEALTARLRSAEDVRAILRLEKRTSITNLIRAALSPAVQRTADRETILDLIRTWASEDPSEEVYANLERLTDAVLAVLVPADQVRAETLDRALGEIWTDDPLGWLLHRAAEYRKAAGA